jgi:hypothetical protein
MAALALAFVGSSADLAHADPPEHFHNIALHPTNPQVFALRYEGAYGGLVLTRNGGQSFQLVPALTFYSYPFRRWIPMAYDGRGKLLLALDSGLDVDDGAGCFPAPPANQAHFSEKAVEGFTLSDVVSHPTDPDTSFILTKGDSISTHVGVWRRDKQGTLTALGKSEPMPATPGQYAFIAQDLSVVARAASMDGVRFYEGGTQFNWDVSPSTSAPMLRVSDDLGTTWTAFPIPDPDATKGQVRVMLVDPSEPFKAIIALEDGDGENNDDALDPLFITRDGGKTFTSYLDKVQIAEAVVRMPDGKILIADRGYPGGLWSADNLDAVPTKIRDTSVGCLAYQAQTQKLLMCTPYELGYYDLAARSFCAIFQMNEAAAFPSCPSAPLEQNTKGIGQLCGGFCGGGHFASAPVCGTFQAPPRSTCGASAVAYDNSNPDPQKRWIEPPGMINAAPRCAGFSGRLDAGVSVTSDAAVGVTGDASAGEGEVDGGDAPALDAAVPAADEAPDDDDDSSSEDVEPRTKHKSGCDCQLSSAPSARSTGFLALLTFALALLVRRGSASARRARSKR